MNAAKVKQTLAVKPLLSQHPTNLKKQGHLKDEPEPMTLIPLDAPENITQYSLDLPSANKDAMLDEMDRLKNITVHLNQIVQTMEHVYMKDDKMKEEGQEEEEETAPEEHDDMISFLIFCSQLSNQLDAAVHEEKEILESLFKWFEKEVQLLEELGEEEIIPDWQVPVADKNVTDNINKLMNRIERLQDLKGRIQELPRYIQTSTTPRERRKPLGPPPSTLKDPKFILEELAMKHASEDVMNMVQIFQDESGAPQTIDSMNNRMVEIMKIFERQTNKLHRVTNEQDMLEAKLQKIQQEFRKLAEEKQIMEDELQKMKSSDITQDRTVGDARKKILAKLEKEKVKVEEKPVAQPDKGKKPLGPLRVREPETMKMKEDLAKAQANIESLEREKKMLEEKLQQVLEEAELAKGQLAETPPNIPDWGFQYTAVEESSKDVSKKGKKGTKLKGKGDEKTDTRRPSASDGTMQKTAKPDTVKTGETGEEISPVPQTKDVKHKKKGADTSEIEHSSVTKVSSGVLEKPSKPRRKSAMPSKTDSKVLMKSTDSVELKKQHSAMKGAGEGPDQEEELLPDSTDQQAESIQISSEEQGEIFPEISISVEPQEGETLSEPQEGEPLSVTEPELADLVTPLSAKPDEFLGVSESSLSLEKLSAIPWTRRFTWTDSTGLQEDEIKDLIDDGMLQMVDHLTELKGMSEAETVAKLLLEPSEGIDEEQREKKRRILAEIASTLNLLDQTQAPEAGPTVEELHEMAKIRRILLADVESNLKDLHQRQDVVPTLQDIEKQINELTPKRSMLLSALESNMKDLKEAEAIAATQPSEMSKNKVKELLQERAALIACLEENQQDLETAKSQKAMLAGKAKHEDEVNELSEKRNFLCAELEKNLYELEEAKALAAAEPSSMNDERVKELTDQQNLLTASLETNLQELQRAQDSVLGIGEGSRLKQDEVNELSEKRNFLLAELENNLYELEEAKALAAADPSSINDERVKELTDQQNLLTASLETNLQELQRAQDSVPGIAKESRPMQDEVNELSEKRNFLCAELEKNLYELEESKALAAAEPSSMNDERVKELTDQRNLLTASLETNLQELQRAQDSVLGIGEGSRLKQEEVSELSEKRKSLLDDLKSNLNHLREIQALAAIEPSSVNDEKIKELIEQRKLLTANLETNLQDLQKAQGYVLGVAEESKLKQMELNEQSEKKRLLQEQLVSNLRDLQQAQLLATEHPESMNELKLQELIEERIALNTELEAAVNIIQEIEHEKELNELSEKKQVLMRQLESNLKDLKEAQVLAAAEPGSISEHELQELTEQRRQLATDLDETVHRLEVKHRDKMVKTPEMELQQLSDKKQLLSAKLESTLKELQEAQAGTITEQKLQELTEQRKQLTAELESAILDMQEIQLQDELQKASEKEISKLLEKKQLLLENLASNLKELQETQAAAAAQPGDTSELKLQMLREEGKRLAAALDATMRDIQKAQSWASETAPVKPNKLVIADLAERKRFLLENLKSNLNELEQITALVSSQPDSFSEDKIQELNKQRKHLNASLDTIIQQIKETEAHPILGTTKKPVEMDLDQLYQQKILLLECLEANLKDLQDAQSLAATYPGSVPKQKIQDLTEQRRLLTTALKTILEDIKDLESFAPDKDTIMRTREIILEELHKKQRLLLENLDSNLKDLQQAQALAVIQPGDEAEYKVKELTIQRRLLAADLQAIMQDIQDIEDLDRDKLEILQKIERKLVESLDNRKRLWKNVEFNLNNLKDLQVPTTTEAGDMQEKKKQVIIKQKRHLLDNLEALIQDLEEAPSLDLSEDQMTSPDGRKNYLLEIEKLEAKLKEIQQTAALSDDELDALRIKFCTLKAKMGLDEKDIYLQGPLSLTKEELAIYGLQDKAAENVSGIRRVLSPYPQKHIRDLQQKSMILQEQISEKQLHKPFEEKTTLEECLLSFPLHTPEDDMIDKYGRDAEQLAKRRVLVAKLEANMRDIQAFYKAQHIKQASDGANLGSKPTSQLLQASGLQLKISKAPGIKKKTTSQHDTSSPSTSDEDSDSSSTQLQQPKMQQKDMEQALRKRFVQQLRRTSLPYALTVQQLDLNSAVREILDSTLREYPAHTENLPLALAQPDLQQANLLAAQKLLHSQPTVPNTVTFHDYSQQPPPPAWKGDQLPATDYLRKLIALKRKLLSPEIKELLESRSEEAKPSSEENLDSILICGKGYGEVKHEHTQSHHS